MAKQKIDKLTAKISDEGQAIKDMVGMKGWELAKRKLADKIAGLLNISNMNIQSADATTIMAVISANKMASDILLAWVKDIEGDAKQFDGNKTIYQQIEDEILVVND